MLSAAAAALRGPRTQEAAARARALLSRPAVFGSLIPTVTLLNAVVGMGLPQMMRPRAFGEYSLVVTLFNYGLIWDFGVSQIIDRWIPAHLGTGEVAQARSVGETLLWLRLGIGVGTFAFAGLVLTILARAGLLPFGLAAGLLAALAGLADMVALGPVCIYRARSLRRNYAVLITVLLSGLVIARPGGLIAGGIVGCFAALAAWYVTCAVLFHLRMPPRAAARPDARAVASLIATGLPFFATSFIWAFYVTGNRWIASFLIEPEQFGQFAFSANIFSLLVGALGGFSAFYYPRVAERIARSGSFAQSARLTRDLVRLIGAVAVVMATGIALSGVLVGVIYPHYLPSVATARVILVAVPPMTLASWLMPVSQSASGRPWIDGVVIFPLATLLLAAAIVALAHPFGQVGVAWASSISALPLVGVQLVALRHARILRARDGVILFGAVLAACLALGLLAWRLPA
jgi:O-antigen/teichoic acid export membrane protein